MSSILKSLKKLENETDRSIPSGETPAFNSRQTLRRRITSRRRARLWFFTLITAGFLVAGGWFFTRSRPVPTPSAPGSPSPPAAMKTEKTARKVSPPLESSPRRPTPALPATPPPVPAPPLEEPRETGMPSPEQMMRQALASRQSQPPQRRARDEMPEQADIPNATPFQNPGKGDRSPSQQTIGKSSAPNPIAPEMIPSASSPPPAKPPSAPVKPPAAGGDASDLAPLSADAGLKLQALAWAPVPESRFVVINSQIIREGEIIEGVKVERIEKEQVVLRKDGKLWQLRHRPQR